jgi:hypothetical protein
METFRTVFLSVVSRTSKLFAALKYLRNTHTEIIGYILLAIKNIGEIKATKICRLSV